MLLKSSDLPYDVKQQVLSQVRDQIGSTPYDQLVDALGEDGVIDLVLAKMSEASPSRTAPAAPNNPWWEAGKTLVVTLINTGGGNLITAVASGYGVLGLEVGTAVILGLLLLGYLIVLVQQPGLSWTGKAAVIGGTVAGAGYSVWAGGPWLIEGVSQWWGWLGGHF